MQSPARMAGLPPDRPPRILFCRTPRYMWPILSEADNFLIPLGYLCLAAALRESMPDVEIKLIDCPVQRLGWGSLEALMREWQPDMVCAGDEAIYVHESAKLFRTAKRANPECITVGGGFTLPHVPEWALGPGSCDYLVFGEGEITFTELVKTLRYGGDLSTVAGLRYLDTDGTVKDTGFRPLIRNLDDLPLPAYDLMPRISHRKGASLFQNSFNIEKGRGCIDTCSFCAIWTQMGSWKDGKPRPRYRAKSPERVVREMEILHRQYGYHNFMFVDGTFNIDPTWNDDWADRVIAKNWDDIAWYGFFRADSYEREHKMGVFKKLVQTGLHWYLVGVERETAEDYEFLSKHNYDTQSMHAMFESLRIDYPEVVRHATFIIGLPDDTREKLDRLFDYAVSLRPDFIAFQTISPEPGTPLWNQAIGEGWLEDKGMDELKEFYWWQPVMKTNHLSMQEMLEVANTMNRNVFSSYVRWDTVRSLVSRSRARRGYYQFMVAVGAKTMAQHMFDSMRGKTSFSHLNVIKDMVKPHWYDL
ncbi:MAG: cobalamin-dependent protein [Myxococcota bacterium]|nr:cobalamin-dependent protein [Myxococcota bacterium]MEC9389341.1 cobalamin-dependent protein [Myxococcota bacterium]